MNYRINEKLLSVGFRFLNHLNYKVKGTCKGSFYLEFYENMI